MRETRDRQLMGLTLLMVALVVASCGLADWIFDIERDLRAHITYEQGKEANERLISAMIWDCER